MHVRLAVRVTIFSTGCIKIQNFMELHALIQATLSYVLLLSLTVLP